MLSFYYKSELVGTPKLWYFLDFLKRWGLPVGTERTIEEIILVDFSTYLLFTIEQVSIG